MLHTYSLEIFKQFIQECLTKIKAFIFEILSHKRYHIHIYTKLTGNLSVCNVYVR